MITPVASSHPDRLLAEVPCALIVYVAARQLEQVGAVLVGQEKNWYPCRGECESVLPRFRSAGLAPEAVRTTPPARWTCVARHLR